MSEDQKIVRSHLYTITVRSVTRGMVGYPVDVNRFMFMAVTLYRCLRFHILTVEHICRTFWSTEDF